MSHSLEAAHWEAALRYAPDLYFDVLEPFKPDRVGVTVFEATAPSPSFDRVVEVDGSQTMMAIEYAIYWDYDIQHLYELEHVWIFVGPDGDIVHCECSSHGHRLIGLLRDRSNLSSDGRVQLFSQPGKHAMSPIAEFFRLMPTASSCCMEDAGNDGLLEPAMFRGELRTRPDSDLLARRCLQQYRFQPSFEYALHAWDPSLFVSWEQLRREIPIRLNALLASLAGE
ncbi:hypothetical protein [Paenibacillus rhizolycopersici]|uniref:hypothetical protein n=1 Tax=Paenibacillus rhizolycopersici TaxID=2780073 RepID=UPI001EF6881D|nr:hypothetical protein [Paenibacillus rhizolycopersici]